MERDPEIIPSEIFDLAGRQKFSTLLKEQQAEVLQYFSAREFDDMHEACMATAQMFTGRKPDKIRESLLAKFDAHHAAKRPLRVLVKADHLWKAASVVLAIALGWQYYQVQQQKKAASWSSLVDTVYVTRTLSADPVRIYDTVYLEKQPEKKSYGSHRGNNAQPAHSNEQFRNIPGSVNVVPVEEIDAARNSQRSNSIKDDSLVKKFSFATL